MTEAAQADDRIGYTVLGTWRSIDLDGLGFDGQSFQFYFELKVDSPPTDFFNSPNVLGYQPEVATLHFDGTAVPLVNPFLIFADALTPGEPDIFWIGGLEDQPSPQPRAVFSNVIELDSTTFSGSTPQPFRSDQITQINDVTYALDPNCSFGEGCVGGVPEFDYAIENGSATGVLVPEPASALLLATLWASLFALGAGVPKR